VPLCVLQSPSDLQRFFLRGVFADGTVCVQDGVVDHISWFSCFPLLADRVRTMLLRQGIVTGTIRHPDRNGVSLCLYNKNVSLFAERIGFISDFKSQRLKLPTRPPKNASIPFSKVEASLLRRELKGVVGVSACQNVMNRGLMSRTLAENVIGAGGDSSLVGVLAERLLYHHDRVAEITEISCPSVCVEVPEGHQFFQNGFSGWNSQGLEYDRIVMPLVEGFYHQLQRNLLYTAITRAKKQVVLVGHHKALVKAVFNSKEDDRATLFLQRLQQLVALGPQNTPGTPGTSGGPRYDTSE